MLWRDNETWFWVSIQCDEVTDSSEIRYWLFFIGIMDVQKNKQWHFYQVWFIRLHYPEHLKPICWIFRQTIASILLSFIWPQALQNLPCQLLLYQQILSLLSLDTKEYKFIFKESSLLHLKFFSAFQCFNAEIHSVILEVIKQINPNVLNKFLLQAIQIMLDYDFLVFCLFVFAKINDFYCLLRRKYMESLRDISLMPTSIKITSFHVDILHFLNPVLSSSHFSSCGEIDFSNVRHAYGQITMSAHHRISD